MATNFYAGQTDYIDTLNLLATATELANIASIKTQYLGSKSTNPTLDNDGAALLTGAIHWNTAVPEMRVWNGTAWLAVQSLSSATAAADSALAASTSAAAAATSYDAFDDRYLGSKTTNPTLDNDGAALLTGAIYWNTTVPEMRVWNGTTWLAVQSLSSATAAAGSALAASTSATDAATSYDAFDDRYLGSKATNPTLNNDGAALLTGAIYWNTAVPEMRVWNGTTWLAVQSLSSATTAANSALAASTSATLSQNWATQLVTPVSGGEYSAKYWASQTAASVTGQLIYRGSWSAAAGIYPGTPAKGDYYKVSVAGTVSTVVYNIDDSIIYNGTTWDKIDSTESVSSVAGKVGTVILAKADVGLNNVDNTTDALKPISTATQTALNLKANLASPTLTGTPKAPTATVGSDSTTIATTGFVQDAVNGRLVKSVAGGVTVTLTAAEGGWARLAFIGILTASIAVVVPSTEARWDVANLTTGAFTLTVKTASGTGVIVTQGFRTSLSCDAVNVYETFTDFKDISLTGTPTAPTATEGTNTTQLATTAFVQAFDDAAKANLVSPTFTGTSTFDKVKLKEFDYVNAYTQTFYQSYSSGSYLTPGEYQEIITITPTGDSQNYEITAEIYVQASNTVQVIRLNLGLRSNTLPDLAFSGAYNELLIDAGPMVKPVVLMKETTTAAFKLGLIGLSGSVHNISLKLEVLNRGNYDNAVMNTVVSSDAAAIPASYTSYDITKTYSESNGVITYTNGLGDTTATSINGITGLADTAAIAAGIASTGTSTLVARQDHVHPAQTLPTLSSLGGQAALVSSTNIKTVNGTSLLGSGNLAVGDVTLAGTQTLTNKTITETVFALTGTTPSIAATNGSVQTWELTAASAPTNGLVSGQSVILVITPGAYTITWPSVVWTKQGGSGALPTLFSAGKTTVVLWMVGAVLYGSHLGDTA